MVRRWIEGTLQSVLGAVVICLIPGAIVAHLVRIQSSWSGPVMWGLGAFALTAFSVVAIDAIRRLPPRRVIPSLKNIEDCVRNWLDNFRFTIKRAPVDNCHFRFLVTVESGTKMYVGRAKEDFSEYLQIRSDITPSKFDLEQIGRLTEQQKGILIMSMRLELARRKVGYKNLSLPGQEFHIFKRIPIRETLTEHEFVEAIDEVEAAVHSIGTVYGMELIKAGLMVERIMKSLDSR